MQKSRKRKTKEENKEQDNDTNIKVVGIIHVVLLIFVTMSEKIRTCAKVPLILTANPSATPGTIFIKEV